MHLNREHSSLWALLHSDPLMQVILQRIIWQKKNSKLKRKEEITYFFPHMEQESNDSHIHFMKLRVSGSKEGLISGSVWMLCDGPNVRWWNLRTGQQSAFTSDKLVGSFWRGGEAAYKLSHYVTHWRCLRLFHKLPHINLVIRRSGCLFSWENISFGICRLAYSPEPLFIKVKILPSGICCFCSFI